VIVVRTSGRSADIAFGNEAVRAEMVKRAILFAIVGVVTGVLLRTVPARILLHYACSVSQHAAFLRGILGVTHGIVDLPLAFAPAHRLACDGEMCDREPGRDDIDPTPRESVSGEARGMTVVTLEI
jgi:hypothetical protein